MVYNSAKRNKTLWHKQIMFAELKCLPLPKIKGTSQTMEMLHPEKASQESFCQGKC